MVTLEQLVARASTELDNAQVDAGGRDVVERIVRATITGLGFHVTNTGEVGDPRPKAVEFQYAQNARWSGGPNRKRRR
jgi:hypothetical protein